MARRTPGVRRAARGFPRDGPARAAALRRVGRHRTSLRTRPLPARGHACLGTRLDAVPGRSLRVHHALCSRVLHAWGRTRTRMARLNRHSTSEAGAPAYPGASPGEVRKAPAYFLDNATARPALGMHAAP